MRLAAVSIHGGFLASKHLTRTFGVTSQAAAALFRSRCGGGGGGSPTTRHVSTSISSRPSAHEKAPPLSVPPCNKKRNSVVEWTWVISAHASAGRGRAALAAFAAMVASGVQPDKFTLASAAKACGATGDLEQGQAVHAAAARLGCAGDMVVGTSLVAMYGKCGSMAAAEAAFAGISRKNVVSWTALAAAYVVQGRARDAVAVYEAMRGAGVRPNHRALAVAAQACGMQAEQHPEERAAALAAGRAVHAACKLDGGGCDRTDAFVCSSLVRMYGKCGSVGDAQAAVDAAAGAAARVAPEPWNALMAVYVEAGRAGEAVRVWERMQRDEEDGPSPDARSFVSAAQACGALGGQQGLETGRAVHAQAWRKGFHADAYLGNTLVSMYGKCGAPCDARRVFDELPRPRSLVAWTAVVAAHAQAGEAAAALELYSAMDQEASPDARTMVAALHACCTADDDDGNGSVAAVALARRVHANARRKGCLAAGDAVLGSALVAAYGRCGKSLADAETVFFGDLPAAAQRNVAAWTAMVAAYAGHGHPERAVCLYEAGRAAGASPNDRTFVAVLQACAMLGEPAAERGRAVHAAARDKGVDADVFVGSTLISMYGKCGGLVDAEAVFQRLAASSAVSAVAWTAMMVAYAQQGKPESALRLYDRMMTTAHAAGCPPTELTLVAAAQACGAVADAEDESVAADGQVCKPRALSKARSVHAHARARGLDRSPILGAALVTAYGKCGSLPDAGSAFVALLPAADRAAHNALLSAYAHSHSSDAPALRLYRAMQATPGLSPDDLTHVRVLQACSAAGNLPACRHIHAHLPVPLRPAVGATLVHAYGACGALEDARAALAALPHPDAAAYTALLAAYARLGALLPCLRLHSTMRAHGATPTPVTYLALLHACAHARGGRGAVRAALAVAGAMLAAGHNPGPDHYAALVDVLARAGHVAAAAAVAAACPNALPPGAWLSVLAACRAAAPGSQQHLEVAEEAFARAVEARPRAAGAYVLMWHVYRGAGMWERADAVRAGMRAGGARKLPGRSWVECAGSVRVFLAGAAAEGSEGGGGCSGDGGVSAQAAGAKEEEMERVVGVLRQVTSTTTARRCAVAPCLQCSMPGEKQSGSSSRTLPT